MRIYGVIGSEGTHIDVSKSLAVVKRYARKNDFTQISCRFHYNAFIKFDWSGTRWIERKHN